jgi:hypothetical protein
MMSAGGESEMAQQSKPAFSKPDFKNGALTP